MEEFNGCGTESGVHYGSTTGTKEQLLTSCITSHSTRSQHPSPGIRYRNLGKSGLRVSNVGLGTPFVLYGSPLNLDLTSLSSYTSFSHIHICNSIKISTNETSIQTICNTTDDHGFFFILKIYKSVKQIQVKFTFLF